MSKRAYYNENDAYAAGWLRNLVAAGHIAAGDVDERSIVDVEPADLAGRTQCHFFAGIAGWSYALQLAGWPDDEPVWTGSCPCQPLSSAGQRQGHADSRHLWPAFHRLIAECRPPVVFGEQVASKDGLEWLAGVRADLETTGYAVGAADLPAAGVGAPHIRQRLFWVADADQEERGRLADRAGRERHRTQTGRQQSDGVAEPSGDAGGLADSRSGNPTQEREGDSTVHRQWPQERRRPEQFAGAGAAGRDGERHLAKGKEAHRQPGTRGAVRGLGDAADDDRLCLRSGRGEAGRLALPDPQRSVQKRTQLGGLGDADTARLDARGLHLRPGQPRQGAAVEPWADAVRLACLDGKARRTLAAVQPLVDARGCICGLRLGQDCACDQKPSRVGMLRGAGNAIVPAAAAEFIAAWRSVHAEF